jgi:tripartite-type tricarboxylate transporter receptor subunit TctC
MRTFLACLLALFSAAAAAQYPSRPVRIICPFPAGGSTDLVARGLAQNLTEVLGQPFVVENRLGGDGVIAANATLQAPPDGHTLFMATNTAMMQVPLMKKQPPYDPVKDFAPVSMVGRYNFLLVTSPSLPAKTMKEFLAYAKANPGKINFATYSSASWLAYAQVKNAAGVDILRVPYKGEIPSVQDVLGGNIHAVFATPASALPHIQSGRLNVLATTLPQRWPALPDVPTTVQAGMPPITVEFFAALFAPAGTPAEITHRLSKEVNAWIAKPGVREQVDRNGIAVAGSTPEELGAFVKTQLGAWAKGFKEAGIEPE